MTIGIVGLGLIGGSIAKALRKNTSYRIIGIDQNEETLKQALADQVIDASGSVCGCDVVYLCLYPKDCIAYAQQNEFLAGAVVTDICGVKRYMMEQMEPIAKSKGFMYIGSHPMAGRELSGYPASDAALFERASYIITPNDTTDELALSTIRQLAVQFGCARITQCSPEEHDKIIAYTSQLAHVVSNSYIKNKTAEHQQGFSAGSFLDLTRVAQLNPEMWTELFSLNHDFLLHEIDELLFHLSQVKDSLIAEDTNKLCALLKEGSDRKKHLTAP